MLVISPDQFRTLPCPTYPQLRLAHSMSKAVAQKIADFDPDAIHVATEGPLGLAVRRWCVKRDLPFTTSYTTKFPEYVQARAGIPAASRTRYSAGFTGRRRA